MLAKSKTRSSRPAGSGKTGVTFSHFRRLLRYVWPHRRYVVGAILCILVMAFTYSASIGSILPILNVLIKPQGLHGWVDQTIAQDRLECELTVYNRLRHGSVEGVSGGTAKLLSFSKNSPFATAGGIEEGDFLLAVNGVEGNAIAIFGQLTTTQAPLEIQFVHARGGPSQTVVLPPFPRTAKVVAADMLRRAVALIPSGESPTERWRTLFVVLLLLLIVLVVGGLARIGAQYLTVLINARAIVDLRRQAYQHVLNLPLSRFSENTSDTMSKFVQDMNDIFRGLNNFFQKMVAEPFKAVGAFCIAFYLNWRLTVFIILVAPIALILFRKLGKKVRRANRKLLIGYGRMLGRLESTLGGMRVVKGYTREVYERRRLFQVDRHVLKQQLRMGFIEALTSPLIETLGFVAASAAILYFARDILYRPEQTPEFMTMLICLGAIFDPLRKLSSVYPKLQRANAAAQRVFELIDTPSEYEADKGKPALAPLRETIQFEHVSFTYPKTDRPAIRDVCLTVRRGETVALVGPNGSGKTTLLSLLTRFFSIDSGRILIDGKNITDVSLRSLRKQFSLISQESVIFADTIRENIAYGRPQASQAEIEDAARKAFADEFIQLMPDCYDTMVGEHGATLSGGQRQRLAIARAILRNAPILIFDEATSQVDPDSEAKIHRALEAFLKDRTAFLIAHRYSTISDADRIIVMDDGQAVAVGTHEELLETCPLYRRLYETQFRNGG